MRGKHREQLGWCLLLGLAAIAWNTSQAEELFSRTLFRWHELPPLARSLEGAFVGTHNEAIIVAGGLERRQGSNAWHYLEMVSVLDPNRNSWRTDFRLAHPLAFGAAVSTRRGVLLIGGTDGQRVYSEILELRWNRATARLELNRFSDLPAPRMHLGAAVLGDRLYVAGGTPTSKAEPLNNFWSFSLAHDSPTQQWEHLPSWPDGASGLEPILAVQNSGEKDSVFMFTREPAAGESNGRVAGIYRHSYRYDPFVKEAGDCWRRLAEPSKPFAAASAVRLGPSHLMFFPSSDVVGTNAPALAYHTLTDTWAQIGRLPEDLVPKVAIKNQERVLVFGGKDPARAETILFEAEAAYQTHGFGFINYLALSGYFLLLLLIGWYFTRGEKSTRQFFLGGKRVPWWAAGLSAFASSFSAISFMALPAKAYATDWVYLLASVAMLPVMVFVIYCFLPFVRTLEVTTAYEYLEKRFNLPVRLFGSAAFIIFQLGRMAIVLLLPALALSTVTGLSVSFCILSMGLFCVIYTVMGGIEAVIWNDCLQVLVFALGAVCMLAVAFGHAHADLWSTLADAVRAGKLRLGIWSWDYTVPCLWVVLLGNFLSNMPVYVSDQSVVQKFLTTSDLRQARRSLWLNFWITVPTGTLFFLLGTAFYVFYKSDPAMLNPVVPTDAILPWFVMQNMPAGVGGFVIAGVFAASMGSLASSVHSVTTALTTDFYRRFRPGDSEQQYVRLARWLVVLIGLAAIGFALVIALLEIPSLLDLFMTFLGLISGGGAGIFLLGILTTRAHGPGTFIGALASALIVFAAQTYTQMHFFLYGAVGLVTAMVLGYVLSLILPAKPKDLTGLTLYTLKPGPRSLPLQQGIMPGKK